MDYSPLTYPHYPSALVQCSNQLLKFGESFHLPLDGDHYQCVCQLESAATLQAANPPMALDLVLGDSSLTVYLPAPALSYLLDSTIPPAAFADLPQPLQLGLIEAGLGPLVDFFQEQADVSLLLEKVYTVDAQALEGPVLSIRGHCPEKHQTAQVFIRPRNALAELSWQNLARTIEPGRPRDYAWQDYAWLPLPVSLELGFSTLPMSAFDNLEVGDTILLDEFYMSEKVVRVNVAQQQMFMGIIEEDILTARTQVERLMEQDNSNGAQDEQELLEEDLSAQDSSKQHDEEVSEAVTDGDSDDGGAEQQEAGPKQPGRFSELPVQLVFVAGRLQLSLQELEKVQPGYVIDLGNVAQGQVEICANGTVIGRGELVQIDDAVGVRCLKLSGK